jgi:hypothetical protein
MQLNAVRFYKTETALEATKPFTSNPKKGRVDFKEKNNRKGSFSERGYQLRTKLEINLDESVQSTAALFYTQFSMYFPQAQSS